MVNFTEIVKIWLIKKGETQSSLADKLFTSHQNVTRILKQNNPNLETMEKIANALDCELLVEFVPKNKDKK